MFGGTDIAGHIDARRTLSDEFFDGLVEGLGIHLQTLAEEIWHLGDVARRPADVAPVLARLNGAKRLVRGLVSVAIPPIPRGPAMTVTEQ